MLAFDPKNRSNIENIKKHGWYNDKFLEFCFCFDLLHQKQIEIFFYFLSFAVDLLRKN